MVNWYAVYTRANSEQQAAINLGNQGYNVYLPRYRKTRRHARKTEKVLRPLFPRYLFVELDLRMQVWHSINGTRGVVSLVTFGESPAIVPGGVMKELFARETRDGSILLTLPDVKKGDRLNIIDGPLANVSGLFERMADGQRALLLLDLLGRSIRVSTPLQSLAPSA